MTRDERIEKVQERVDYMDENHEKHSLPDGFFDVTNIERVSVLLPTREGGLMSLSDEDLSKLEKIIQSPDACTATAYEVGNYFVFEHTPRKLEIKKEGYLNQGAVAIINVDQPMELLIIAEND